MAKREYEEHYLELLADYAARQTQEKTQRRAGEVKRRDAEERRAEAKRARFDAASVRRSEAVQHAYRHALLLALGGRSASALTALSEGEN